MTDDTNNEDAPSLPRVGVVIRGDGCSNFKLSLNSVLAQECAAELVIVVICDGDAASFYDCIEVVNNGVKHSVFGRLLRRRYGESASYNVGLGLCSDCDFLALVSPGEVWHKNHVSSLLDFVSERPSGEVAVYVPSKFNIISTSGDVLTKKRSRGPVGSYFLSLSSQSSYHFCKSNAREGFVLGLTASGVPLVETKGRTWSIVGSSDLDGFDPEDPTLQDLGVNQGAGSLFSPDIVDEF